MFSNINNHCTFNNEHNWEDLCTFDDHDKIKACPFFNMILAYVSL